MSIRPLTLRENVAALLVAAYEAEDPKERARLNNLAAKARITGYHQDPGPTAGYCLRHGWSGCPGVCTQQCVSPFVWKLTGADLDAYNRIISDRRVA